MKFNKKLRFQRVIRKWLIGNGPKNVKSNNGQPDCDGLVLEI